VVDEGARIELSRDQYPIIIDIVAVLTIATVLGTQ
jgi:hypothetical protein